MRCRLSHGLTLIESLVALVIVGILATVVVPSFNNTLARTRLDGVVNELSVDLQYARSTSIRRRAAVTLATAADGQSYTISIGSEPLKSVPMPAGLTLTGDMSITFDPLRGTAESASLDATSRAISATLRVSTSAMGRVQLCSPSNSFGGYAAC